MLPTRPPHYEQKASLRAQARADCSPILRSPLHQQVRRLLEADFRWQAARTVLVYWPMPHEIDLSPWWQADADGKLPLPDKQWVFPRMSAERSLSLHRLDQVNQWHDYPYGLREPDRHSPVYKGKPDLCLLPALGMDRQGYRLGSGYGFYDRWLAGWDKKRGVDRPVCWGVIPHRFLHEALPRDPWDIPLNGWVSEQGIQCC